MKKNTFKKIILGTIVTSIIFLGMHNSISSRAASCLFGYQGGTGLCSATSSNIGQVLTVSSSNPFVYYFSTPAGGAGSTTTINGVNGPNFTIVMATSGASGLTITSSGLTWTFTQATSTDVVSGFLSAADHALLTLKGIINSLAGVSTSTIAVNTGTGIGLSTTTNSITINNTGVTSIVAGSNATVSNSTGTVTVGVTSTPSFNTVTTNNLTVASSSNLNGTTTIQGNLNITSSTINITSSTLTIATSSQMTVNSNLILNGTTTVNGTITGTGQVIIGFSTLSNATNTITVSGLTGPNYSIRISIPSFTSTTLPLITFNNDNSASYSYKISQDGGAATGLDGQTSMRFYNTEATDTEYFAAEVGNNILSGTAGHLITSTGASSQINGAASNLLAAMGYYKSTTTISSITLTSNEAGTNFATGTTVYVYSP